LLATPRPGMVATQKMLLLAGDMYLVSSICPPVRANVF
jgi:hypothetical protein